MYIDPKNKLFQHLDRLSDIKDGAKPAPVNVEIDLTNRCNLGCKLCHFAYTHSKGPLASSEKPDWLTSMGDQMPLDMALNIIDQLSSSGVRSITWTGGGEPTVHPQFDHIINYASLTIPQGVYTNGTLITTTRADNMKEAMDWVYVSLDRHTQKDYKEYKGTDTFPQVIQGIKNLVKSKGKATIGVGFLLDRTNWGHGNEMIQLADDLGVDYVQFRPAIEYDLNHPNRKPADVTWIKPCIQWLEGVQYQRNVIVDTERFAMYRNWQGHPYKTCFWTQLQTVITPNGKVWRCVNRRGFPSDCIGDLTRESFDEIWERSGPFAVNENCRIMCRGELPNRVLDHVMDDAKHKEFI